MYYHPESNQLISDGDLSLKYNLIPGSHDILLTYGFHHVEDNPPQYNWMSQKLVKGEVEPIDGSPYFRYSYTIVDLTPEEIEINAEKKKQLDWIPFRKKRDHLLKESDWTQIQDYALISEEERLLWAEYRQALRDLPEIYPDSDELIWPSKPGELNNFLDLEPTEQPEFDIPEIFL